MTAPERVDHGGEEDHVQSRHGDGKRDIRGFRQHLSFPIYERTKGRLLIEIDLVVELTVSTIRVPYNESMGDFIAKNTSNIYTPLSVGKTAIPV